MLERVDTRCQEERTKRKRKAMEKSALFKKAWQELEEANQTVRFLENHVDWCDDTQPEEARGEVDNETIHFLENNEEWFDDIHLMEVDDPSTSSSCSMLSQVPTFKDFTAAIVSDGEKDEGAQEAGGESAPTPNIKQCRPFQ